MSSRVTLNWIKNPPPDSEAKLPTIGYEIVWGTASRSYTQRRDVGNVTTATIEPLIAGMTYFFVVRAYNRVAMKTPSSEVNVTTSPQG